MSLNSTIIYSAPKGVYSLYQNSHLTWPHFIYSELAGPLDLVVVKRVRRGCKQPQPAANPVSQ